MNWLRKLISRKGNYKPFDNLYVWGFAVLFVVFYTIVGYYHNDTIQNVKYEVQSSKPSPTETMKIAMYSDSHMGAGASQETIAYASDRISSYDADIAILDGDIVDGSTSLDDLEFLTSSLKNIKTKYDVYFIWGNHDDNCIFDWEKALTDAGVKILKDEAVHLPNGAFLVGRDDRTETDPTTILEASGFTHDQFDNAEIVVAQHRPKYYELFKGQCDVMLSGHTHGYPYPVRNPTVYLSNEMMYGMESHDNLTAITSSGLSTWGFHSKWPSFSEIVEVTIHFN